MKQKSCLLFILAIFIVSIGVYYLTRSFLMSAGIMIVIMLIDAALAQVDRKRQRKIDQQRLHEERDEKEQQYTQKEEQEEQQ